MTPQQWADIITQTQQLWGHSPKWRDATNLYTTHVRTLPYQTMLNTLTDLALAGRPTCPPPAELIGLTHQRTDTHPTQRPDQATCRHTVYAVHTNGAPHYQPTEYTCAHCLHEWQPGNRPAPM
jgi:hypothetical protein